MGEKREPVAWKLTEESTVAMRDDGARLPKYGGANCAQQPWRHANHHSPTRSPLGRGHSSNTHANQICSRKSVHAYLPCCTASKCRSRPTPNHYFRIPNHSASAFTSDFVATLFRDDQFKKPENMLSRTSDFTSLNHSFWLPAYTSTTLA